MPVVPAFTVEEIKSLQVALNAAMEEATKKGIDIPLDAMLRTLFAAAANGERDPEKLKAAMSALAPERTPPSADVRHADPSERQPIGMQRAATATRAMR